MGNELENFKACEEEPFNIKQTQGVRGSWKQ